MGTDALALGVNFPAEKVVFCQLAKYYDGPISKNLFDQLAGRAGRPGYYDTGYVFYCDEINRIEARGYATDKLYKQLLQAPNESMNIDLTPNYVDILSGRTTVDREAEFIVNYSTSNKDIEAIRTAIQEQIDYIKNYSLFPKGNDEYGEEEKTEEIDNEKQREMELQEDFRKRYCKSIF